MMQKKKIKRMRIKIEIRNINNFLFDGEIKKKNQFNEKWWKKSNEWEWNWEKNNILRIEIK